MKIGVLGAGPWGRNHIRIYSQLGHEVVACDLDEGAVGEAAKEFGCGTANDYRALMEDEGVAAVSICTPASSHFKFAKEFLDAGKHALVEKPLALGREEAAELARIAESKGLTLMVGHVYRFDPGINRAREMISGGELGKIYYVYAELAGLKPPRTDCGVLHNYAVHEFDIMCNLLGEWPERANCFASFPLGRPEFEDLAVAGIRFPSGAVGFTQVSWLPAGKWRGVWAVGEKKTVYIDTKNFMLKVFNSGVPGKGGGFMPRKGEETEIQLEKIEPLKEELSNFIAAIEGKGPCRADGQVGARVAAVIDACEKSIREKREVEVGYV